jgi:hypothetical protein
LALVGLPEYGVTLSGSPENPVLENHSGRVVIGYDMETADAGGGGLILSAQIMAPSVLPAGIPDGVAIYVHGNMPVGFQRGNRVKALSQGPILTATLHSVVFADGQFVGTDEQGAFEVFAKKFTGVTEAGKLAKTQAWDQLEALDQSFMRFQRPPGGEDLDVHTFRQLAASRLVETRKFKGDAAAAELAEIYSSLPTLWK